MRPYTLLTAFAALILLGSCSDSDSDPEPGSGSPTATDHTAFITHATEGLDVDYDPLPSAAAAVEHADLIVVGNIASASEAKVIVDPQSKREWRYAILEVEVERTISGPADAKTVFVALDVSRRPTWAEIEASLPATDVLLVLHDLEDWDQGQRVGFPAKVYSAYHDGFWIDAGSVGPVGVRAERTDLETRWGKQFSTFDSLVGEFEQAARD